MKQVLFLAIGYGFLYYVIEYQGTKAALYLIGIMLVGAVVGFDTQIEELKAQISAHARKLFPRKNEIDSDD